MAIKETKSGSQLEFDDVLRNGAGQTISRAYVDGWNERIKLDLDHLIANVHPKWDTAEAYIRNNGQGKRIGNVVSEFIKTLHARLLARELNVSVESDNPKFSNDAEKAEIVSQSVQRIAGLLGAMRDAASPAAWASFGLLEVGHPIDPALHDPQISFRSPNYERDDSGVVDQWEEASEDEVSNFTGDSSSISPFDEQAQLELEDILSGSATAEDQAQSGPAMPVFRPGVGYPYVQSVDPRLIVFPVGAKNANKLSYIARIRFMTREELKIVQDKDFSDGYVSVGQYKTLFNKTSEDGPIELFPTMMMVVEVYVRHDRNNPQYNNWYFSYVFGDSSKVIRHGPNPNGGMHPFVFIKLDPLRHMFDLPLADDLIPYADAFDLGARSLLETLLEQLNRKTFVENGAGINDENISKLRNPNYKGVVKGQSYDAIKEVDTRKLDVELLKTMQFVKSLAQTNSGQSDLDRGQAIKEITARQTQALLDATGINIETMAIQMADSARTALMKLMHLTGIYSMVGRDRAFSYGGKYTNMDRGSHDFTTSYTFIVKVQDAESGYSSEDRLTWVQFLRTLFQDTDKLLVPYFDREGLATHTRRIFDTPVTLLASRAAGREGSGMQQQPEIGAQPTIPGNLGMGLDPSMQAAINDGANGQHPERDPGSRGIDMGNMLTGALNIGSGTGEL